MYKDENCFVKIGGFYALPRNSETQVKQLHSIDYSYIISMLWEAKTKLLNEFLHFFAFNAPIRK